MDSTATNERGPGRNQRPGPRQQDAEDPGLLHDELGHHSELDVFDSGRGRQVAG